MSTRRYLFVAVMWVVVLAVNFATGGEVTVFGDATIGPVSAVDQLVDGLVIQGLVVR